MCVYVCVGRGIVNARRGPMVSRLHGEHTILSRYLRDFSASISAARDNASLKLVLTCCRYAAPAGLDRWQQAKSRDAGRRRQDRAVQEGESHHLRVGDPREAHLRR